jgi:gliding motility-associated-like protein
VNSFSFLNALFVPIAFAPNANPLNQVYRPALKKPLRDYHFRIYNRWGQLLFYIQDPEGGWDGTYRGQLQQEGVYVYTIELDGASYRFRGTFYLLR